MFRAFSRRKTQFYDTKMLFFVFERCRDVVVKMADLHRLRLTEKGNQPISEKTRAEPGGVNIFPQRAG